VTLGFGISAGLQEVAPKQACPLRIARFQEDFCAANFTEFSVFSSVFSVLSVL
jgi:hypothetical protein